MLFATSFAEPSAVLDEKRKYSPAKKRRERLDNVIPIDHRLSMSRSKLVNRPHPQFRRVTKLLFSKPAIRFSSDRVEGERID